VDWREPDQNSRVLDWRRRAHDFGLVPVEGRGAGAPEVVEPADRLLEEEEPEAFDEQPVYEMDREGLEREEVEEEPEARLPQDEVDLVRVYLRHIGRRKLLTATQEQEIGRAIEERRGALLGELATIPAARRTLLALADEVRQLRPRGVASRAASAASASSACQAM